MNKIAVLVLSVILVGVVEASSAQEACEFIKSLRNEPASPVLKKLDAEKLLGRICDQASGNVCGKDDLPISKLYQIGIPKDNETLKELIDSGFDVWASKVDINNDGIDEIRIFSRVGTAKCTRSYFYSQDNATGEFKEVQRGYEVLSEEGRFCDGRLSFIRYQDKIYALEAYTKIDMVWRGSERGLIQQCSYNSPQPRP